MTTESSDQSLFSLFDRAVEYRERTRTLVASEYRFVALSDRAATVRAPGQAGDEVLEGAA